MEIFTIEIDEDFIPTLIAWEKKNNQKIVTAKITRAEDEIIIFTDSCSLEDYEKRKNTKEDTRAEFFEELCKKYLEKL